MDAKQFTREELEKMFSDYLAGADSILKGQLLSENEKALSRNTLNISKQLLAVLKVDAVIKPGFVSAEDLEVMIHNHETYWIHRKQGAFQGDIEGEYADMLPNRIIGITKQLIEMI